MQMSDFAGMIPQKAQSLADTRFSGTETKRMMRYLYAIGAVGEDEEGPKLAYPAGIDLDMMMRELSKKASEAKAPGEPYGLSGFPRMPIPLEIGTLTISPKDREGNPLPRRRIIFYADLICRCPTTMRWRGDALALGDDGKSEYLAASFFYGNGDLSLAVRIIVGKTMRDIAAEVNSAKGAKQ